MQIVRSLRTLRSYVGIIISKIFTITIALYIFTLYDNEWILMASNLHNKQLTHQKFSHK